MPPASAIGAARQAVTPRLVLDAAMPRRSRSRSDRLTHVVQFRTAKVGALASPGNQSGNSSDFLASHSLDLEACAVLRPRMHSTLDVHPRRPCSLLLIVLAVLLAGAA